ncbi:hypothetical protein Q4603_20145 [Zobellia galactanivorans]|uniref:hypothetical protein n=1 Tax=Zobellia galactanivorans (strain DSM 12802 / CCUG 47099 / CIP 106680 / NCIMB 13871 / Dsij) TaxID=63186 RepID=UPI001C07190F|nr:hypothetical protein [Zobellia galactanivorans]MBU3025215.1 hypothetical protein [Zobellia galactanivorans]MDO6810943.1 hypothetical protein [Zobellia galactanivorans]
MENRESSYFKSVKSLRSKRCNLSLFSIFSIYFFLRTSTHFDNRAAIDLRESFFWYNALQKGDLPGPVSQVRSKVETAIPSSIEIGYALQGRAAGSTGFSKVVILEQV